MGAGLDAAGAHGDVGAGAFGRPAQWAGEYGGNLGGLAASEIFGAGVEVVFGGGFDAIDAGAELGDIKIDFEDTRFADGGFEPPGEGDFEPLAQPAALGPEEEIFGSLLADGAGAFGALAALVVFVGFADGFPIEALVLAEEVIFGSDDGGLGVAGNGVERCPGLVPAIFEPLALGETDDHERRERWIDDVIEWDEEEGERNENYQSPEDAGEPVTQEGWFLGHV